MSGFGGGSWGGGAWGGASGALPPLDVFETVTISEGLDVDLPFFVVAVEARSPFVVEVQFSHTLDGLFAANSTPANYLISPALSVVQVFDGPTTNSKLLVTSEQGPFLYTLTVVTGRAAPGDLLQPAPQLIDFAGFAIAPRFFATAQSDTKVMLIFSTGMLQDAAFTDPSNYSITDLNGTVIPVLSVVPQGPAPITRATLTLGTALSKGGHYVAEVDPAVVTLISGFSLNPLTDVFQWTSMEAAINVGPITIPISDFSGEVSDGLLGQPAGQIFFSPALLTAASNSVIQIEEVSLCTRAYDSYEFPQPIDPPALFTFSPTAPAGTLGTNTVLWAPAEQLGLARVQLRDTRPDVFHPLVDGLIAMTLLEPIDISRGGFLNDSRWHIFDGSATTFSTYDNLTPTGPGPVEYLRAPYDLGAIVDSASTGVTVTLFLSDIVTVADQTGLEKLVVVSDSMSATDTGDVYLSGGWTGEFSPEFE